jgi:hypothetical protein
LRNLSDVSAWLRDTDPSRDDMVIVNLTREDVQQATASRQRSPGGSGIRASIRRAIERFGIGGGRKSEMGGRQRSKSVSSATASVCTSVPEGGTESVPNTASRPPTRQPSIAGARSAGKGPSPPVPSRQPSMDGTPVAKRWSIRSKFSGSRQEQPKSGPRSTPSLVRSRSGSSRVAATRSDSPHLAVPTRLPSTQSGRSAFSESVPSSPRPSIFRPELSSPPRSGGSSDTEASRRGGFGRVLDRLRVASSNRSRQPNERSRRLTMGSTDRYDEYEYEARARSRTVSTGSSSRLSHLPADDASTRDFSSEEAGERYYQSDSSASLSDVDDYGPMRKEDQLLAWNTGDGWHYAASDEAVSETAASPVGGSAADALAAPLTKSLQFGRSPFDDADTRRFMSLSSGRRASVAGGGPAPTKSSLSTGPHALRNAVSFEGGNYYSGDDEDEHEEEEHEIEVRPRRRKPQQASGVTFRGASTSSPPPPSPQRQDDRYIDP